MAPDFESTRKFKVLSNLCLLLAVSLLVRLLIAPFSASWHDLWTWWRVGHAVWDRHISFYHTEATWPWRRYAYPPVWGMCIVPMYAIYSMIGVEDMHIFNFLVKLPVITADLAVGVVLFRLLNPLLGKRKAITTTALWLLNPLTIKASAFGSNFESIATLCILLAIEKLINGDIVVSGIYAALAFCTRQSAITFLPMIVVAAKSLGPKKTRTLLLSIVFSTLAICVPFFLLNPEGFLENIVYFNLGKEPFGLTWWLIPIHMMGMPVSITGLMFPMMLGFSIFFSCILYRRAPKQLGLLSICEAGLVGFFIFILTSVEVGATFFVSALPLFLIEARLRGWRLAITLPAFNAQSVKMYGEVAGGFKYLHEGIYYALLPVGIILTPFTSTGIPRATEIIFGVYYLLFSIFYLLAVLRRDVAQEVGD